MYYSNDISNFQAPSSQCAYTVHYKTELACLPAPNKLAKCYGKNFNLVPLVNDNHQVRIPGSKDFFYIGLCHPTLYGHNILCPPGSSICLVKGDTSLNVRDRYLNVGSMTSEPQFISSNKNVLKLTSDTVCKGDTHYSSFVNFHCDRTVSVGEPVFMTEDNCVYYFNWRTKYACGEKTPCQAKLPNGIDMYVA